MQKRSKKTKEQERANNAQIFNEAFQMGYQQGYKVGEADALRKLQNNDNSKTK